MSLIPFNQLKFFEYVQEELGPEVVLATWLEEEIGLSRSGAYRRLKDEQALTVSELITIAKYCPRTAQWATDLFKAQPLRLFHLHPHNTIEHFELQLTNLERMLEEASNHDDFQWDFIARDLPLFYFFKHPEMLKFKLKVWTNSLFKEDPKVPDSLVHKAKNLWNLYRSLPTRELWCTSAFKKQQDSLEHLNSIGCIEDKETEVLINCLSDIQDEFRAASRAGEKGLEGRLEVHCSPAFTLNNASRITFNNITQLFGTLHDIQYYQTSSPDVVGYFDASFQQHLKLARRYFGDSKSFLFSA